MSSRSSAYVSNSQGNSIVTVNPTTGAVTPFPTTGVALDFPSTLLADSSGNLYVFQSGPTILKIPTTGPSVGVATTLATLSGVGNAMTFGFDGNIYVTTNTGVSRVTLAGAVTPFASGPLFNNPIGIALGPDNNLYAGNASSNNVLKVSQSGEASVYATGFSEPWSLSFIGTKLYVSDDGNSSIAQLPAAPPVSVPALSGWGMILAAMLLGGTGFAFAARRALSARITA